MPGIVAAYDFISLTSAASVAGMAIVDWPPVADWTDTVCWLEWLSCRREHEHKTKHSDLI